MNGLKEWSVVRCSIGLVFLLTAGCSGFQALESGADSQSSLDSSDRFLPPVASKAVCGDPVPVRRLTSYELINVLKDLLGDHDIQRADLPTDNAGKKGFFNSSAQQTLSEAGVESLLNAVLKAVDNAIDNGLPPDFRSCPDTPTDACLETGIVAFVNRAFRRPVDSSEAEAFLAHFRDKGGGLPGLRAALRSILISPRFLFVIRNSHLAGSNQAQLTNFELAERLALAIWNRLPDRELTQVASSGGLANQEMVARQLDRLLSDPRADEFIGNFVKQWLSLSGLDVLAENELRLNGLPVSVFQDIQTETLLYVRDLYHSGRPLSDLLKSTRSFVNADLAEIYGLPGNFSESQFVAADLAGLNRPGLLGQASILAATSSDDATTAVKRGHFVVAKLLCQSPPSPPADLDVEKVQEDSGIEFKTEWDKVQYRTTQAACMGCHRNMDPVGLTLENFDGLGRWRTMYDNGEAIKSQTNFNGRSIASLPELSEILAEDPSVGSCITEHMASYLLEKEISFAKNQECLPGSLGGRSINSMSLKEVIKGLVLADQFRAN